jgi:hypothetical protein
MPTPDPSLLPAAISAGAAVFTSNYNTILLAVVALIGIITLPLIVVSGVLHKSVSALRHLFSAGGR